MEYIVKLNTNGSTEIVEKPSSLQADWYSKQIGCDYFEIVRPINCEWTLLVDEEGLLKDSPQLNIHASKMYGTFEHNQPIVGTALLMKEGFVDGSPDLIGLAFDEAKSLKEHLDHDFPVIVRSKEFKAFLRRMEG